MKLEKPQAGSKKASSPENLSMLFISLGKGALRCSKLCMHEIFHILQWILKALQKKTLHLKGRNLAIEIGHSRVC